MHVRIWVLIATVVLAIGLAGCTTGRVARGLANTPVPTKTLRPTFTPTVPEPTLTPSPTAGQPAAEQTQAAVATIESPSATPVPPTPEPSPTVAPATFTVTGAALNVRGGPGTNYANIGRLTSGQSFPITGKNANGTWWQFDYNGRPGWVIGTNVTVSGGDAVQIAQNIPAAPTSAPRPTARPAAPTSPPAPPPSTAKYAVNGTGRLPNTNNLVTVYCLLFDRAGKLIPGTMRVMRDGQTLGSASFEGAPTYYLGSGYNAGCKVEVSPATNGNYTAVIVEGDTVVSDPITFAVTGEGDRIIFANWKQR